MKAKIFRISGYLVETNNLECEEGVRSRVELLADDGEGDVFQQLHIDESEEFDLNGEDEPNCDLALLTRHFKKVEESKEIYDRPIPKKGERYSHFKLGKIVTVIGISRHTETEELTVVYRYENSIWNRPLSMFMSEVDREKYPNSEQKYRFERVRV